MQTRPDRAPSRGRIRPLAALTACLALAACGLPDRRAEAELKAQFDPVETRADFVARATGRAWQSDEIRVRFAPDGTLAGEVNGVPVTGDWRWQDRLLCTAFHVGDSGGDGCSEIGIRPGEMLVVPLSGRGAPYTYTETG